MMKSFAILSMFCFLMCCNTYAQNDSSVYSNQIYHPNPYKNVKPLPKLYIGTSIGINNFNGMLGVTIAGNISNKFFIRGGAGFGNWGKKLSAGFYYQGKAPKGFTIGASYSRCLGIKETNYPFTSLAARNYILDLKPVDLINLDFFYYWAFKRGNRMYLTFGYCMLLTSDYVEVISPSNATLTIDQKNEVRVNVPGGFFKLCTGFGFEFGL